MISSVLARCGIGCQIAVLGMLGLLGMAVVAGIGLWGSAQLEHSNAMVTVALDARNLDSQLQIALLDARRSEKNLLIRREAKYVQSYAESIAVANTALNGLRAHAVGQPKIQAQLENAISGVARYAMAFEQLAQAMQNVGLVGLNENEGLEGELRSRVHDVEAAFDTVDAPKAQIAMLMMRRHEKDFIIRRDPKYGAALKAELPAFTEAVNNASIQDQTRVKLLADMTAYQNLFSKFMASTLARVDSEKSLMATFIGFEPDLAAIDQYFVTGEPAAVAEGDRVNAAAQHLVMITLAVSALMVMGLSWLVGRGIAQPILAVTRSMQALVSGDLSAEMPADGRRDEIGTMVRAVRAFRDSLVDSARLRDSQESEREQATTEKQAALVGMAEQIEMGASVSVGQIGERTSVVMKIVEEMGALAGRSGDAARNAADAATSALGTAQTVASASEQLSASIREISRQVGNSTAVVNQAVQAGHDTRAKIEALNKTVGLIGAVADIIGDIAAKTNLLALNATIEAARAGDAGKGFAVVAGEVKQLATQTRRSTEEITSHINQIRAATIEAVTAVDLIGTKIGEVEGISGSIAAAVEEQRAATAEIARNVAETASAVNHISAMNADVANAAEQTGQYAHQVLENTRSLNASVDELKQAMVRTVRTSAEEVDRRKASRYQADLPCRIEFAGQAAVGATIADISVGGAQVSNFSGAKTGLRGKMRLDAIGTPLDFTVLKVSDTVFNIAFDKTDAIKHAVGRYLEGASLPKAA